MGVIYSGIDMDDKFTDVELMLKVKDGDQNAFKKLYERYGAKILNFFYRLSFNRSVSEECVQEVFFKLWKARTSYKPSGKFTTYLFQIAKNLWVSYARRLSYQKVSSAEAYDSIPERAGEKGPDSDAMRRELAEKVRDAVKSLPDNLRIPFVLSRYEGLSYEEIGEILSTSPRTVEGRVADAAKILSRKLLNF